MTENFMKGGKIRRWFDDKGFGFVKRDGGGPDLFLHRHQVIASGVDPYDINENVRVYFDVAKDKSGRDVAVNIKLP
jgi:cold shock CspA family protein